MFPPSSWDPKGTTEWCQSSYNEDPQFNWIFDYYGGKNPKKDFMKVSNIIFSNGELDPWHAGGVLETINP